MIFRAKKHIYLFPTPASKTIPPSRDIKNPSIFKITNFNFSTLRRKYSIPKWKDYFLFTSI